MTELKVNNSLLEIQELLSDGWMKMIKVFRFLTKALINITLLKRDKTQLKIQDHL